MTNYLYDGTFAGLLTVIFKTYRLGDAFLITAINRYLPNLLDEVVEIETDEALFQRVSDSVETKLSRNTLKNIYYLYLSEAQGCEVLAYNYLKLCYEYGDSINLAKNNDIISEVDLWVRRVSLEAHRFKGFVRFKEIGPLTFYSGIAPDHNILPLLETHFTKRFSDQNFIIHDTTRQYAMVYNQAECLFTPLSKDKSEELLGATKDQFEELFTTFYKALNIKERANARLQRQYMPLRYRKYLTELS